MKALTVIQPWATAIALGSKKIETRSWETSYRGPLLIHAARTKVALQVVREHPQLWRDVLQPVPPQTLDTAFAALPFGAAIAVCELVDCVPTGDSKTLREACRRAGERYLPIEPQLGNFVRGRWAWFFAQIRPLRRAIPMRGWQGLFEPDVAIALDQEVA